MVVPDCIASHDVSKTSMPISASPQPDSKKTAAMIRHRNLHWLESNTDSILIWISKAGFPQHNPQDEAKRLKGGVNEGRSIDSLRKNGQGE
jgi:hypothetical protein